jgi:hypothetical protein
MNMSFRILVGGLLLWLLHPIGTAQAQELEPGAYSPSPDGANIVVIIDSFSHGELSLDPSLPISDARADINTTAAGYVRTFGLFDRSANFGVAVPYVHANFSGLIEGEPQTAHRSAFGDTRFRLAINLFGAPAMTPREFATWQESPSTIVGMSLVVVPPTGAYDPTKLVNVGFNRWSFRPEVGFRRANGHWTFEADAGVWVFTDNNDFYGGHVRHEDPIVSLQGHVIYTFRPRMWLAYDVNYYTGGRTTVDGKLNFDLQQNTLGGFTFALPLTQRQSIKFTTSRVVRATIGGNYNTFGIGYQFVWLDHR